MTTLPNVVWSASLTTTRVVVHRRYKAGRKIWSTCAPDWKRHGAYLLASHALSLEARFCNRCWPEGPGSDAA